MTNVIKLRPREEAPDELAELLDSLKVTTDQLIFIQKTKDGNFAFGHSPLKPSDLVLMYHHINKYIANLLDEPEEDNA
jgi:hypothetical protein